MAAIFSWGYEAPVKEDYTKDNADISNKIRKMKREYISEQHDNFRRPEKGLDSDTLLFNYFDQEEIDLFKKRLYAMHQEQEKEARNQSTYKELFCKPEFKEIVSSIFNWTAAGKPRYGAKPDELRMPLNELRAQIEDKLVKIGFKREVAVEACQAFYLEFEHCSESPTRSRVVPKGKSPTNEQKARKSKKAPKPAPPAHCLADYFEPDQIERFKQRLFKVAAEMENFSKRAGEKLDRPWKTDDTNLVGLTTYKENHCWRHVKFDKENGEANGRPV